MVTLLNLRSSAALLRSEPEPLATGPRELRRRPRAPGARTAGDSRAALAIRGEQSLRHYLPLHDTGSWSIYGLYRPGFAWRTHLADRRYHCYHVTLLRQLAEGAPAGSPDATCATPSAGRATRAGWASPADDRGGPEAPAGHHGQSEAAPTFGVISSAMEFGTSSYEWNCIVKVARPWVAERTDVA